MNYWIAGNETKFRFDGMVKWIKTEFRLNAGSGFFVPEMNESNFSKSLMNELRGGSQHSLLLQLID